MYKCNTEVAEKARFAKLAKTAENNVEDTTGKGTIHKHLSGDTILSAKDDGKSEEVEQLTKQTKKPEAAIDIVKKEVTPAKLETIDD